MRKIIFTTVFVIGIATASLVAAGLLTECYLAVPAGIFSLGLLHTARYPDTAIERAIEGTVSRQGPWAVDSPVHRILANRTVAQIVVGGLGIGGLWATVSLLRECLGW